MMIAWSLQGMHECVAIMSNPLDHKLHVYSYN